MSQTLRYLIEKEINKMEGKAHNQALAIVGSLLEKMEGYEDSFQFVTFIDDKLERNRMPWDTQYIHSGRVHIECGVKEAVIELGSYKKKDGPLHIRLDVTAQNSMGERTSGCYMLPLTSHEEKPLMMMNIYADFDAKNREHFQEHLSSLIELDENLFDKVFLATLIYLNKEEGQ